MAFVDATLADVLSVLWIVGLKELVKVAVAQRGALGVLRVQYGVPLLGLEICNATPDALDMETRSALAGNALAHLDEQEKTIACPSWHNTELRHGPGAQKCLHTPRIASSSRVANAVTDYEWNHVPGGGR